MTKSPLAKIVRAWAKCAKASSHTMSVYGMNSTLYGYVSKEGQFFKAQGEVSNAYCRRLVANTIGMDTKSKEGRQGILRAINYFKKEA